MLAAVVKMLWCAEGVSRGRAESFVGTDRRSTAYVSQHDGRLRLADDCARQASTVLDALRGTLYLSGVGSPRSTWIKGR